MVGSITILTIIAYGLVHASEERECQPQLPQAAPLKDLADGWAREPDAIAIKDDSAIDLLERLLS